MGHGLFFSSRQWSGRLTRRCTGDGGDSNPRTANRAGLAIDKSRPANRHTGGQSDRYQGVPSGKCFHGKTLLFQRTNTGFLSILLSVWWTPAIRPPQVQGKKLL